MTNIKIRFRNSFFTGWLILVLFITPALTQENTKQDKPSGEHIEPTRIEEILLELLNKERILRGLNPLHHDRGLADLARMHSSDMIKHHFFSHVNHENLNADMRRQRYYPELLSVRFGENIASTYGNNEKTVAAFLMESWMKSDGHRREMLSDKYSHVGIGVAFAGDYKFVATQNFCFPLAKVISAVPSEAPYGSWIRLEFEDMGNIPRDKLRVVVLSPDENVKIPIDKQTYFLGKCFLKPTWKGRRFFARIFFKYGKGMYNITVGKMGAYHPQFLKIMVK